MTTIPLVLVKRHTDPQLGTFEVYADTARPGRRYLVAVIRDWWPAEVKSRVALSNHATLAGECLHCGDTTPVADGRWARVRHLPDCEVRDDQVAAQLRQLAP